MTSKDKDDTKGKPTTGSGSGKAGGIRVEKKNRVIIPAPQEIHKGLPSLDGRPKAISTSGWGFVFEDVWKARTRKQQRDEILDVLLQSKDDADVVGAASWLLQATAKGYVHGKSKDGNTVHLLGDDDITVYLKNYLVTETQGELDFIHQYTLNSDGGLTWEGFILHPTGMTSNEDRKQSVAYYPHPIVGCTDSVMNDGWEYGIQNYNTDTGDCELLTPGYSDLLVACYTDLASVSTTAAPQTAIPTSGKISGIVSFDSTKKKRKTTTTKTTAKKVKK